MLREKRKLRSVQYARKKTLECDGSFGDGTLPELCQNKNRTVRATFFAGKRDEMGAKVRWQGGAIADVLPAWQGGAFVRFVILFRPTEAQWLKICFPSS